MHKDLKYDDENNNNSTLSESLDQQQNNSEPTPNSRSGLIEHMTSRSVLGYFLMLIGTWMVLYIAMTGRSKGNPLRKETAFPLTDAGHMEKTSPSPNTPNEDTPPPLPATGLPEGWTIEQWNFYGHQWIEMNER